MARWDIARFSAALALAATFSCSTLTGLDGLAISFAERTPSLADDGGGSETVATADYAARSDGGATAHAEGGSDVSFCASLTTAPTFCDDFDEAPTGSGWNGTTDVGGTLAFDTATATSLPRSRRVTVVPAPSGTPCRYVQDTQLLGKDYVARVRVEHDVFLGHVEDTGAVPFTSAMNSMVLSGPDDRGPCDIYFDTQRGATNLVFDSATDRSQVKSFPLSQTIGPRKWVHLAVEVASSGLQDATVSVWMNGVVALESVAIPSTLLCNYGRIQSVEVGFRCVGESAFVEARVDNLVVWTN